MFPKQCCIVLSRSTCWPATRIQLHVVTLILIVTKVGVWCRRAYIIEDEVLVPTGSPTQLILSGTISRRRTENQPAAFTRFIGVDGRRGRWRGHIQAHTMIRRLRGRATLTGMAIHSCRWTYGSLWLCADQQRWNRDGSVNPTCHHDFRYSRRRDAVYVILRWWWRHSSLMRTSHTRA